MPGQALSGVREGLRRRIEAAAAAPTAAATNSPGPKVSKRPCPGDCGARSAALPSGEETASPDAAGWGGEAGLVTRPWVHVNTVERRSPALPPPNHRSRRVGGGRGQEPASLTRPSYYGAATSPGPSPGTCAEAARRRRRPRSVLLACGFCSQELSHPTQGKALHPR